jgi:ketosteroid isomerase-like protein
VARENVEAVRLLTAAMNRGDAECVIRHTTTDVVMILARSAVEGPFVGHEGVRRVFADSRESFEVFELHEQEVRDLGDDRVFSCGVVHVRGRGGGVEVDIPYAGITTFRDGMVSRWEDFRERSLALKSVGLRD